MRVLNSVLDEDEMAQQVQESVLTDMEVPIEKWGEAKSWDTVKHKVSNIMMKKLVGRPTLERPYKANPRPGFKKEKAQVWTYPRWVSKDSERIKLLKEKLADNSITVGIYLDLIEVLDDLPEDADNIFL